MQLPEWLATLFAMFTLNYKNNWTDTLYSDQLRKSNDALWFNFLKHYPREIILNAGELAIKTLKFPPNIYEFLEIADSLQRKKRFDQEMINREKNRQLEKLPNKEIGKKHMAEIFGKLGKKSKFSE